MRPEDPLYQSFENGIVDATPDVLRHADAAQVINRLSLWAQENTLRRSMPRVGMVRTAVQRSLNEHWMAFPKGDVHVSRGYDRFNIAEADSATPMYYESRLAVVGGDDTSEGILYRFLEKLVDGAPSASGGTAILHITAPVEANMILSVDTINFAVVKSKSGESFWYTLEENRNKGKVMASEAREDETGAIREKYGRIDTLPLVAIPASVEQVALMLDELKHASGVLIKETPPQKSKSERAKEKASEVGSLVLSKARQQFSSKS